MKQNFVFSKNRSSSKIIQDDLKTRFHVRDILPWGLSGAHGRRLLLRRSVRNTFGGYYVKIGNVMTRSRDCFPTPFLTNESWHIETTRTHFLEFIGQSFDVISWLPARHTIHTALCWLWLLHCKTNYQELWIHRSWTVKERKSRLLSPPLITRSKPLFPPWAPQLLAR